VGEKQERKNSEIKPMQLLSTSDHQRLKEVPERILKIYIRVGGGKITILFYLQYRNLLVAS
jgi:hypothetical protein